MNQVKFSDKEVQQLLLILKDNANAVEKDDAIRWSPKAADRIEEIKNKIESQTS
jgi:hypothetical protein